jgi:hypothetical protein
MIATQVVRVELPAAFEFKAGQYCELRIPAISESAWKPFTIASSPLDRKLTFYIKDAGNGGWTTQLCKLYQEIGSSPSFERTIQPSRFARLLGQKATKEPFEIHVRGPYGAPAQCVDQFEHVVLVAGGIGATPMISAVRNLVMTEMQRESIDGLPEKKGVYASNPECFARDIMDMQHLLEPRFIEPDCYRSFSRLYAELNLIPFLQSNLHAPGRERRQYRNFTASGDNPPRLSLS